MINELKKPKNKIVQLFCHHNALWYKNVGPYHNLSGEKRYKVCKKCGKILDETFIPYG